MDIQVKNRRGEHYRRIGEYDLEMFVEVMGFDQNEVAQAFAQVEKASKELAAKVPVGAVDSWFQPARTRSVAKRQQVSVPLNGARVYPPSMDTRGYHKTPVVTARVTVKFQLPGNNTMTQPVEEYEGMLEFLKTLGVEIG